MGVIADTSVFIRAERAGAQKLAGAFPIEEEAGVSTITIAELLEGVHHAHSPALAERRRGRIRSIAADFAMFAFTYEIAEVHARVRADLRKRGALIGAHDLIIAATALHLGWRVVTANADEFGRIPELVVISI
jgi:tRNA(fMet)-specific endonuclease VapC